jgi:hypothetical protein
MELTTEYHTSCLKNKLQTNLTCYLLANNNRYTLLCDFLEILKKTYETEFNELEYLKQHIFKTKKNGQ